MDKVKIDWIIKAVFNTPFHIGSGAGLANMLDMVVLKDKEGVPYIPASSLKGKARANFIKMCESIKETDNQEIRICENSQSTIEKTSASKHCLPIQKDSMDEYCALCRIFGSYYYQSGLRFTDLKLEELKDKKSLLHEHAELLIHSKSGNKIDRLIRTTEEDTLFNYETVEKGHEFTGRITGEVYITSYETALFKAAILMITHLGGLKSRGMGRCSITITDGTKGGEVNEKADY